MSARMSTTAILRRAGRSRLTSAGHVSRRYIQISASPTSGPSTGGDLFANGNIADPADARFEVLGAPYSLLSVSLSASQRLYTRRGTLVSINGKAENTQSTLSVLEPFRRAPLGIPFLYQRITSTTPITALVSTKSPVTSFVTLHLDGTTDWMVAQRNAVLAWTGHTLSITPTFNRRLNFAHWGNSKITGRGLVALAGPGQVYQVTLAPGEEYVVHPGNVVAYSIGRSQPVPYRLKSSNLRFQVPDLGVSALVAKVKFFRSMKETTTWKAVANFFFGLRTAARRSIWGDRLFLKFQGPSTILLSSRASRISDVLTTREINEIADTPPGAVEEVFTPKKLPEILPPPPAKQPTTIKFATVGKDGKVNIEDTKGEKSSSA